MTDRKTTIETEAKIKVEDFDSVICRLLQAGAVDAGPVCQSDIYFDRSDGGLAACGSGLRLRKERRGEGGEKIFLTYKGPRRRSIYKSRQETEIEVSDFDSAMMILEALGCQKLIEVRKDRHIFVLGDCRICLDELPVLGRFVEVEGPNEDAINQALKDIGLDGRAHIAAGYARLMSMSG